MWHSASMWAAFCGARGSSRVRPAPDTTGNNASDSPHAILAAAVRNDEVMVCSSSVAEAMRTTLAWKARAPRTSKTQYSMRRKGRGHMTKTVLKALAVAAALAPAVGFAQGNKAATYITDEEVKAVNALPGVDRTIKVVDIG